MSKLNIHTFFKCHNPESLSDGVRAALPVGEGNGTIWGYTPWDQTLMRWGKRLLGYFWRRLTLTALQQLQRLALAWAHPYGRARRLGCMGVPRVASVEKPAHGPHGYPRLAAHSSSRALMWSCHQTMPANPSSRYHLGSYLQVNLT